MGLRRTLVAVAAGGVGIAAGTIQATPVHATLTAVAQPRATGVVVATLRGRTLSWRLTFNGLDGPVSARLSPGVVLLCRPCVSGAARVTVLPAASAAAVRGKSASVMLTASRGALGGPVALGTVPTLQLLGIADGDRIRLPATVRYAVTGFRVGPGAGQILAVTGKGDIVGIRSGAGVIRLPDDKRLTGRRDLTFSLVRADGTPLENREARVTVYGLLLAGRR